MTIERQFFKLDQNPRGRGLRCDQDGLFLAGEPLLVRSSLGKFQPRSHNVLRKVFGTAPDAREDLSSRIRGVEVVARSLNKGDLAHAMMAAVLMGIPERPTNASLAKANFDPDEPRDDHGRWTRDGADDAKLVPVQMSGPLVEPLVRPLFEPEVEPILRDTTRPPPGTIDIVPPITNWKDPGPIPRNPYPHRQRCVEEWDNAYKYCEMLWRKRKLGTDKYRGHGRTLRQCMMGQVSEDCGGSPVSVIV